MTDDILKSLSRKQNIFTEKNILGQYSIRNGEQVLAVFPVFFYTEYRSCGMS